MGHCELSGSSMDPVGHCESSGTSMDPLWSLCRPFGTFIPSGATKDSFGAHLDSLGAYLDSLGPFTPCGAYVNLFGHCRHSGIFVDPMGSL